MFELHHPRRCVEHGHGGHGRRRFGGAGMEWGFGAPERGGGRGGRRRVFDGGSLRLILLKLIEEAPRHGYDLIREIEARSGGTYAPSPGIVYPTLTMLSDMDLIAEQASEGAKKMYAITAAGQAHLTERAEEVAALMARLAELGAMRSRDPGSPVRRAMGNLRQVLQDRLGDGDLPAGTLHDVAAILDEAAQRIERL